jgi:16S rRNA (cytosine967-C5)-methyltransferase
MKYIGQHVLAAQTLAANYSFEIPLLKYLKEYFSLHKKHGKKDRKTISDLLFAYFKGGQLKNNLSFEQVVAAIAYLSPEGYPSLQQIAHEWLPISGFNVDQPFEAKAEQLSSHLGIDVVNSLFPFDEPLSSGLTKVQVAQGLVKPQPLYVHIWDKTYAVTREMDTLGWQYTAVGGKGFMLPHGTNLEQLTSHARGLLYVQDLSSQMAQAHMHPKAGEKWWDACCGSGGKSLLLKQKCPEVALFGSDVRKSILKNYQERMARHKVTAQAFVFDLESTLGSPTGAPFRGILLDVPCTGSGTWNHHPEMLHVVDYPIIMSFASKQLHMVDAALGYLETGGELLYMTCSLFAAENEEVVAQVCANGQMELLGQYHLHHAASNSNHLFAARLRKLA